jgi:hypothetical protein
VSAGGSADSVWPERLNFPDLHPDLLGRLCGLVGEGLDLASYTASPCRHSLARRLDRAIQRQQVGLAKLAYFRHFLAIVHEIVHKAGRRLGITGDLFSRLKQDVISAARRWRCLARRYGPSRRGYASIMVSSYP